MSNILVLLAACLPTAIAARAGELASPQAAGVPTHAGTIATSRSGDYLKFRQTQTSGEQSQTLTLWHVYRGSAEDKATVRLVLTNRPRTDDEPIAEAAQDVRIEEQPVPLQGTLLDSVVPPGVTLESDTITKLPAETLVVGPRSIPCQVFERVTRLAVPEGQVLVTNRLWWSGEIPVSGLVRSESRTTGLQSGGSTVELVAFSGMNDPSKIAVDDPKWFLAQAYAAIQESGEDEHRQERFLEKLGEGYLAHGEFFYAQSTLGEIRSPVYQESLVSSLRAHAAAYDGPGEREALGLETPEDLDQEIAVFGNTCGNHLARVPIEEVEKIAARVAAREQKDRLWACLFWRMLLKGDREGAAAAFQRIASAEGRDDAVGSAAYRAAELGRLDLLTLATAFHPPAAERSGFLGSHYHVLDRLGREKEAREVARRYVAAILALPEAERLELTTSALVLALYRPWSRVEPFVVDGLMAGTGAGDPEADLAKAREQGTLPVGVSSYAQRAAARGDEAAARRILASQPGSTSADARQAIVALYAAGKEAEAAAWARTLAPGNGEHPFLAEGVRARIYLDFSTAESFAGDAAAEARWLDEAEKSAVAAQQAMCAFNREKKLSLYWPGGVSIQSSAPFFLVGVRLVARGEHERALAFARNLPSLMPGSRDVEDFWKHMVLAAGKRGDEEFAAKVVAALPASIDANARGWFLRDAARAFAVGGDVEGGLEFIAGLEDEKLRNIATCALVVQLGLDRRAAQAGAVFEPWIANQPPKQWADAKVALAMAEAAAGNADRARDLFLADRFRTDFTGITGLDREDVLVAVGFHAARAKPDPTALGRWVVGVADDYERAHLALGMAFGLAKGPVPDEFADPVGYSEL